MTNPRTRMAAVAGSLAVSLSLVATPAVVAQDDPTAPVQGVITAMDEGRLTDTVEYFCADLQATALGGLGQLESLGDMGLPFDLELLLGAIDISIDDIALEVVEQGAESAKVGLTASIETGIDEEGIVAFLVTMMSTEEMPLTEEMVESMLPMMLPEIEAQMAGSSSVEETIDVILEDGAWKVCSDLSSFDDVFSGFMGQSGTDDMDDADDAFGGADDMDETDDADEADDMDETDDAE